MGPASFVGRAAELAALDAVVRGSGPHGAALVVGDAGIGKSRLVLEAAHRSGGSGSTVLVAGFLPLSTPVPLLPLVEWVRELSRPPLAQRWAAALDQVHPALLRELDGLVPRSSAGEVPTSSDPGRLFAAVREALGAVSAAAPVCLVAEDLHWADPGSLDLLTYLLRTRGDARWTLLVTSREAGLDPEHPARRWLSETARVPGLLTLRVTPLQPRDVRDLVARLSSTAAAERFVAEIVTRSAGNPFFVEQLVAHGPDDPAAGVPDSIGALLRSRLEDLDVPTTTVLRVLAVAGHALDGTVLADVLRPSVGNDDVGEALQRLVARRLVVEGRDGDYRLAHALLGEVVTSDLSSVQRRGTHRAVARALVEAEGVRRAAEIAGHLAASGDRDEELPWALVAAQQAERLYAWRDAVRLWRRSWEIWDSRSATGTSLTLGDVAVRTADCLDNLGEPTAGDEVVTAALTDSRLAEDTYTRARLLTRLARFRGPVDVAGRAELLEEAVALFATLPPSGEAAKAMLWSAETTSQDGLHDLPADRLQAALEVAVQTGALDAQIRARTVLAIWTLVDGRPDDSVHQLYAVWELARRSGHFEHNPASTLVDVLINLGRFDEAVRVGRRDVSEKEASALLSGHIGQLAVANLVEALLWQGRTDDSLAVLSRLPEAPLSPETWWTADFSVHLAVRRGDLAAAQVRAEELAGLDMAWPEFHRYLSTTRAELLLWTGRPAAAWTVAAHQLEVSLGLPVGSNSAELLGIAARAAADTAWLEQHPGAERDRMRDELTRLAEGCRAFEPHPARLLAQLERSGYDAELSRLTGSAAPEPWTSAARGWSDVGAPHREAYARLRLAECLLDLRQPTAAEPELAAAARLAQGHVPLAAEVAGLARRAGLHLAAATTDQAPADQAPPGGEYGLTAREGAVLELLVEGLTNVQIGRRLYMSPKTASVHVSSILRKLRVANRLQAATLAERSGLVARSE